MSSIVHVRRWARVGVAALLATPIALAGHAAEAAIITDPGEELTRFEIDGDPVLDVHSAVTPQNDDVSGDWGVGGVEAVYGELAGSGTTAPAKYPTTGIQPLLWASMVAEDAPLVSAPGCSPQDDNWNGGVKVADITNMDDVSGLTGCGQVLNKGDLIRAYTAYEVITVDGADHMIIYGAWERGVNPGELYFYVPISDGAPGNTAGDRLIAFDYDSSSGQVSYRVLAWNTVTEVWYGLPAAAGDVFQGAVGYATGEAFAGGNPSFGEFALDLTAAGVFAAPQEGECIDYTTAGYVFTETGNSGGDLGQPGNAQLKDFISATPLDLNNCADVTVTKLVEGAADWSFDFTIDPVPGDAAATLTATDENPSVHWGDLLDGEEYTISETIGEGWDPDAVLTCTGVTDLDQTADHSVTFEATAGAEIECTVTNHKLASITIDKVVIGTDAEFPFSFGDDEFTLSGADQPVTYGNLSAGTYSIAEQVLDGYTLTDVTCTGEDGLVGPAVDVDLAWGEDVTCTFTNTQQAKVVVVKQTTPDGAAQEFPFTFGETGFGLSDGESWDSGFVTPGVEYTISEGATANWVLSGVSCDNGVVSATSPVSVTPQPGQTVTCTFNNTARGPLSIDKTAGSIEQDGDSYTLTYDLVVTSASHIAETFDLSDAPAFAPNVTITSFTASGPGVTNANPGVDGGEIVSDGTIPALGVLAYTITVAFTVGADTSSLDCDGPGTATYNTATVTFFSGSDTDDACADIPTPETDLQIVKTAPAGPFAAGVTFDWTLVVTNNGPTTAYGVSVADNVPTSLVVNGVTSSDFTCDYTGNAVSCARPSLAAGASGTITISVTVPFGFTVSSVTNVATVTSDTPDTDPDNNTDDATVPLVQQAPPPPPTTTLPAAAPVPPSGELPATGGSVGSVVALAAALLAVGAVVLAGARRRRPA